MTRMEFMMKLGALLKELPDGERLEALRYYNDYFADAGEENEQQVIEELGSPEKIAEEIYGTERWETLKKQMAQKEQAGKQEEFVFKPGNYEEESSKNSAYVPQKKKMGFGWKLLLLVVLCPIWIPVAAAVFGAAFGILMGILGILIAVLATGVAGIVAGVAVLIFGIIRIVAIPSVGVLMLGVGAILLGAGILAMMLIPLCWRFICWLIRTIVNLLRRLFGRDTVNA